MKIKIKLKYFFYLQFEVDESWLSFLQLAFKSWKVVFLSNENNHNFQNVGHFLICAIHSFRCNIIILVKHSYNVGLNFNENGEDNFFHISLFRYS
jgi:hypothetical protein